MLSVFLVKGKHNTGIVIIIVQCKHTEQQVKYSKKKYIENVICHSCLKMPAEKQSILFNPMIKCIKDRNARSKCLQVLTKTLWDKHS